MNSLSSRRDISFHPMRALFALLVCVSLIFGTAACEKNPFASPKESPTFSAPPQVSASDYRRVVNRDKKYILGNAKQFQTLYYQLIRDETAPNVSNLMFMSRLALIEQCKRLVNSFDHLNRSGGEPSTDLVADTRAILAECAYPHGPIIDATKFLILTKTLVATLNRWKVNS
jgi:hypothetical protein